MPYQKGKCQRGSASKFTHNAKRQQQGTPRGDRKPTNQQNHMYPMVEQTQQQTQQQQNQQVPPPPQPYKNEPQRVEIQLIHSTPKS